MKKITHLFSVVLLIGLCIIPLSSWGQNGTARKVLMPQFGKQIEPIAVEEVIEFYDPWEYKGFSGNPSSSYSSLVFEPSEGYAVQIAFSNVDVKNDGTTYPGYLNIYNGFFDPNNTVTYPSAFGGVTTTLLPTDNLLKKFDGTYTNETYISTDVSGALSVGFHWKYAKKSQGWVAKVSCVKVEDMTITGAGSSYEQIETKPYAGKKAVNLVSFYVDTEGIMNPENLTSVSFTLPTNGGVVDPAQIKLYAGSQSSFTKEQTPLEATLTENSGTYTFTLTKALASGRSSFSIVADIKPDATFGGQVSAVVTKVTTTKNPEGVTGFVAAESSALTVPHMVLLSATPATYNAGNTPIDFYDDGGKDANISDKFSGQVTFIPTSPGKKIMVTFNKLDLFNTNPSNNDILNIYNGEEVSADQLSATLLKQTGSEPIVVKSIAADGSLTITLESTTGVTKPGFEAVVTEFEPQQMTVGAITATQYAEGTVVAGDMDQPILSFNIRTENTEPALVPNQFSFTTNGTFANVAKAVLYATKSSSTFATTKKVGEVVITVDQFEVTCTDATALTEGDNYFWLAYEVGSNVADGDKIDAALVSVTLNNTVNAVADGNPAGDRVVKNEFISTIGMFEKKVIGSWVYTHTPTSEFNTNYKAEIGDQIVTFVPATKGKIMELDFKDFNVFYSSSATGTRAKFEIYSGRGTSGTKLWELIKSEDQAKGPGSIIRSQAGDGSITVVFNANTTTSSYTAKGWHAEAREYKPSVMTFKGVTAFQASTDMIKAGILNKDQEIIGFKMVTGGNLSKLILTDITLNLKGSQSHINKVTVYYAGTDSLFTTNNPIASEAPVATTPELSIPLTIPMELPEGPSYFWVTYDTKEDIASDLAIDASLTSVTLATGVQAPLVGDPEGKRRTMNIYLMENGIKEVNVNGSMMFYDDAGPDANYSKTLDGTVTFVPKQGEIIKMVFRNFYTNVKDDFFVYDGREAIETNQIAKLYGNKTALPDLLSMAEDGTMTVKFKSTINLNPGWEIEVLSYVPKPLVLGEVKVTAVNNSTLLKGAKDVQMLRVDVEVKGDKGLVDLTQLDFNKMNTTDASVAAANVYCTDTVSSFSLDKKFADALTVAPYTFNGSYKATRSGVYKFWLTYDVAPTANLYDKIEAKLTTITANEVQAEAVKPVIASATIKKGFSGTYAVGEDTDYPTIASAVAAMKGGIDGPIVFELEKGIYNELVTVPEIEGASDINTITIRSKSGKYGDVIVTYNTYNDDKDDYGVFTVSGADNLTIEGITLTGSNAFPILLHVKNASRYLTVKNCRIYTEMATSYGGTCLIYTDASKGTNNDFFTLENNLIEGGYNGLGAYGTSINLTKPRGTHLFNNTFRNQGAKGMYVSSPGETDMVINGNLIYNNRTTKTDFNAIDITACEGLVISNNIMTLATKNYATGIYLRQAVGTADKQGHVFNNEINLTCAGTPASYGINLTGISSYLNLVNNTVRVSGGNTTNSAAINLNAAMNNTVVQNNIFQNEARGYVYRMNKTEYLVGTTFSNNVLHTNGTEFAYATASITTFEAWKTASKEVDSYAEQTLFLADDVLEPASAGNLNHAKPLAYVTADLNGTLRNATTPTIGAYEYADLTTAPAMAEGYPVISGIKYNEASVTVKSSLSGKAFLLVKQSDEAAPALDEVLGGTALDVRKDKEVTYTADGLNHQTDYKCYLVLQNLKTVNSEVLVSEVFTTEYLPTEVSTFEAVTAADNGFTDGTAAFGGFTVTEITDGIGSRNTKAAQINGTGTVTLTNSTRGVKLTGFYLKSDAVVTLKVTDAEPKETERVLAETNGKWIFCNLKDMGKVVSLTLTTTGNTAYIDNFSGEPQAISFALEDKTVTEGDYVMLSTTVSGGVAPYTYAWKNAKQEVLASTIAYSLAPKSIGEYTLTVTDAWGVSATRKTVVKVEGNAYTATFEDIYLEPNSRWRGDEVNGGDTKFYSGSYAFDNNYTKEYSSWSGFAYSNETARIPDAEFRAAAGSGVNSSANYAVAYVYTLPTLNVTNKADGDVISGCYVTNTAWAEDAILNGDGMSTVPGGFAQGDYFKLTAKGLDKDGALTAEATYYLADYRADVASDHYYLNTWQWLDLNSLGTVKKITFSLESTKKNAYGMTTPAYFCLDDVNGKRIIADRRAPDVALGKTTIPLAQFFTFEDADASIVYAMEGDYDSSKIEATLKADQLEVDAKEDNSTTSMLVKAIQKGKIQYSRIVLNVDNAAVGVGSEDIHQVSVYPVPATDRLNIDTDMEDYTIEVIAINGAKVLMQTDNTGNTTIRVSDLASGLYLIKLYDKEQTIVKRFTKVNE